MEASTGSTAVATIPTAPSDEEISRIRQKGNALIVHKREVNALYRTIAGMEWGSGSQVVRGSSFSDETRYAFAEFCHVTGANPMTQVDVLGGKPYLNASYWVDRIINDPMYVDLSQRDITEATEQKLRALAKERREAAHALQGVDDVASAKQRVRALDLEEEAESISLARANWKPPEWATCVVETTIRRFMNSAPMEAIRAGKVKPEDVDSWIVSVSECNWAGNHPTETKKKKDGGSYTYQPDPVGNAEPEKTARTRSLRRCATRTFSAWMQRHDQQIRKAEQAIEAEFEIIQEDTKKIGSGAVATGNGEPESASAQGAKPLPVRGEPVDEHEDDEPASEIVEDPTPAPEPEPPFDATDARKRFFATLHDCGIPDKERKAWCKDNGFPESTKDFKKADFDRAQELLVGPIRKMVTEGCDILGLDMGDLSLQVLGKESPDYAKDWIALRGVVEARATGAASVGDDTDTEV